ncbi:MAG: PhzF family phenazine biosynthesis protein [Verrucomicrobiota bacterium]
MTLPFFWVDAFSAQVFGGNPAGVVPLARWPEDALMQRIAAENGLSETAFLVRTGHKRLQLRWFTPACEVDLCGHATLAAAFVTFAFTGQAGDRVVFDSRSGPLPVVRGADGSLELDFPGRPARPVPAPAGLLRGLGATPAFTAQARDTLCVFNTEAEVRALRPDFAALVEVETFGVIATAPGDECDFVSRFFAPRAGVPEDPVTGSAHCTLVPYWAERLGRATLEALQVSARGGRLRCTLDGERVRMAGHCALYLRGELQV